MMGSKNSLIGVFFDTTGIDLVRVSSRGRRIEDTVRIDHQGILFDGNYVDPLFHDPSAFTEILSQGLTRVSGSRKGSELEVHVSMDDLLSNSVLLQMAALPPRRNEAMLILERKIHDSHPYLKQREMVMDYRILEEDRSSRDGMRCLVTFMLKSLSDALKTCFSKAGAFPLSLDSAWSISAVAPGVLSGLKDYTIALAGRRTTMVAVIQSGRLTGFRKANQGLDQGAAQTAAEIHRTMTFLSTRGPLAQGAGEKLWITAADETAGREKELSSLLKSSGWSDLRHFMDLEGFSGLSGGMCQATFAALTGER